MQMSRPSAFQIVVALLAICCSDLCAALALGNVEWSEQAREERILAHFQTAKEAIKSGNFEQAAREYEQVLRLDPNLVEAHANLGLTYHMLGQYQKAVGQLEKALEKRPTLLDTNVLLGIDYLRLGFPGKAIPVLQRALHLDPSNREANSALAGCFLAQGNYIEATKQFRTTLSHEPDQMEGLYDLGKSYQSLAKRLASRLSQAYRSSPWSYRLSGDLLAGRELWADAAVEYRQALAISPEQSGSNASLGRVLLRIPKVEEAETAFLTELQANPDDEQALLGLAEIGVRRGAADSALKNVSRICQFFPSFLITQPEFLAAGMDSEVAKKLIVSLETSQTSLAVQFLLANLHEVIGENEQAREQWATLQERLGQSQREAGGAKKAGTDDQSCQAHRYTACVSLLQSQKTLTVHNNLVLGEALFALQQYDRAADAFCTVLASERENLEAIYWLTRTGLRLADDSFAKLVDLFPDSWRVHQIRGDYQKSRGAYNQAIDEYQAAVRLHPLESQLYESLGESYLLTLSYDQAEKHLKQALQLDQTRAYSFFFLGRAYLGRRQAQDSIPYFQTALRYNPALLQAHAYLGQAYMRIGKPADAVPELETSISVDYHGDLHHLLYNAYRQLGKPELAQKALARSEELRRASAADHQTKVAEAVEELEK